MEINTVSWWNIHLDGGGSTRIDPNAFLFKSIRFPNFNFKNIIKNEYLKDNVHEPIVHVQILKLKYGL